MPDTSDYVLPNGYTFFASTVGYRGTWACDKDPVSAARRAADRNGPYPHFVQVWYAPYETTEVNDNGGLSWMSKTAMKKSKDKRLTHEEFMDHWFNSLNKSYQHWVNVDSKKVG